MRVLVIGVGSIGARHAQVIHELGGHELLLADTRDECLREIGPQVGATGLFTDYRAALDEGPDCAIICSPNTLHAPMAVDCARAGCHLLIEKPVAHSVEAAREIAQAVSDTGVVASVGYVLRFWPGVGRIGEMLRSGAIGDPLCARVMLGARETLALAKTGWRAGGDEEGGPLLDYSHEIDYLRMYLGEVSEVGCMVGRLGPEAENMVTVAAVILGFGTGALGELHIDYLQHPARRELDIIGDRGRLFYDFRGMRLTLTDLDGNVEEENWSVARNEVFAAQFRAFEAACGGLRTPEVPVGDAARTLNVALTAAQSARERRVLQVTDPV